MDPWSMNPLRVSGPWTGSAKIWTGSMNPVHGPSPWTPISTTTYKQRLLACLIAGSSLHVSLPALSHVDESKHCSFYYDSFEFPFRFFYLWSFEFFSTLHVDEYYGVLDASAEGLVAGSFLARIMT